MERCLFFELVCLRNRDQGGAEGIGNTYTAGEAADAILSLIRDDLSPFLVGADAAGLTVYGSACGGICIMLAAADPASFALSAIDIALWRLLGRHNPEVLAYAGEIDLFSPWTSCWPRPRPIWTRVFTP